MTTMTLDELTNAIKEWQEEHNGIFIFLAKDDTCLDGKNILSAYTGIGSDLSCLLGTAMEENTTIETIVKMALKGLSLYRMAKEPCDLTN